MEDNKIEFPSEEKKEKPSTKFVKIPLNRGFEEIKQLWDIINHDEVVIAGGYARFCGSPKAKPQKAGDIDLFPKTEEASQKIIDLLLSKGFEKRHENEISYTFKKHKDWKKIPTIQVIKPFEGGSIKTVGTIEEILDNFDFTVTRIAILNKDECIADVDFLEDDTWNKLRIKNIHCPVSSLLRVVKYGKKGFSMRPMEAMKLFADWDERDEDYKIRIIALFQTSAFGEMTKEEVDQLESLLRID